MKRNRHTRIVGTAVFGSVFALTIVGCSSPPLASIAADCGGESAGVSADDSGVMIDVSASTEGLLCVIPKVFSDQSDQYAVALAMDEGVGTELTVDEREVKVGSLGGAPFVFIGTK